MGIGDWFEDQENEIKKITQTGVNMVGQSVKKLEDSANKKIKKVEKKVKKNVKHDIKKVEEGGKKAAHAIESGAKTAFNKSKEFGGWAIQEVKGASKDVGEIIGGFFSPIISQNLIPIIVVIVVIVIVLQFI